MAIIIILDFKTVFKNEKLAQKIRKTKRELEIGRRSDYETVMIYAVKYERKRDKFG